MQEAVELNTPKQAYFFRPYEKEDLNFVQSSWGYSFYKGTGYAEFVSPEEFHSYHRPIRERILKRKNIAIIVCCSTEDPTLIIGWILVEEPKKTNCLILHYVYVKHLFNQNKIARELTEKIIKDRIVLFTHLTEKAARIMTKNQHKYQNYYYIPPLVG